MLGNLELAWSEFLAVWGLEPVRVVLRTAQPRLGLELGAALSRYLDESHEITQEQIVKLAEEVGRTAQGEEPA